MKEGNKFQTIDNIYLNPGDKAAEA